MAPAPARRATNSIAPDGGVAGGADPAILADEWTGSAGGGPPSDHNFGLIAPMPDWLISELRPPPPRFESVRPQFGKSIGESNAKVQGVLNKVAQAGEGNRNGILFWGACCIGDMVANRELSGIEASRSLQALHNISL